MSCNIYVTPYSYPKYLEQKTKAHHDAITKRDKSLTVSKMYVQGAR